MVWRALISALASAAACLPGTALALTLEFPEGTRLSTEVLEPLGSYALPIAGYDGTEVPVIAIEGQVTRQAWTIPAPDATTLQMTAMLRAQVKAAGFEILFECQARTCGGFDFRFETEVLPAPEMHVDLGDYRFLAAQRAGDGAAQAPDYVSLLISRSSRAGFVQVIRAGQVAPGALAVVTSTKSDAKVAAVTDSLAQTLEDAGRVSLDDLQFDTGGYGLSDGNYGSLMALADYLLAHPAAQVTLVGHTDAEGSLSGNMALSKRRAGAVAARLIETHGVPRGQITYEGIGFLSPRATNLTEDGKAANRRVEVILSASGT